MALSENEQQWCSGRVTRYRASSAIGARARVNDKTNDVSYGGSDGVRADKVLS